jgi:hypothetical protein
MAEERTDEKQQVKSEDTSQDVSEATPDGKATAYEKKALDQTGRDWSKRRTFKPEGTV